MNLTRNIEVKSRLTNPIFLKDKRFSSIISEDNAIVSGGHIDFNSKISNVLAAIGEFFERERFMPNGLNKRIYKDNIITGYSFIDQKTVEININNIISSECIFVDSCGLASHTNSKDCIFNAISEFIERQSFIFNYLSKGRGILIKLDNEVKFKYVLEKFEDIKFYNISLIEDFYVILGKTIYNGKFYIGLGASNDIDKAIFQCIKEIFQMDYFYLFQGKKNNKERMDYIDMFMSLSTDRINEAYKYLDENCIVCEYKELVSKEFSIDNIFRQLNKQYNMKPVIFFLAPLRMINNLKLVKVLDLNWFPNLFPKSYEEKVYNFVEKATHKELDRKCEFIPFP